jgi:hemoglobin
VSEPTLFDQVGGDRLRTALTDFYDRVFADVMIGYLFAGKNKAHLIEREWEMTARMLGASAVTYTGRSMREAHGRHQILGGHFDRRLQLLRDALAAHDVPAAVCDAIVAHSQALRPQITADRGSECDHDAAAARTAPTAPEGPVRLGRRG